MKSKNKICAFLAAAALTLSLAACSSESANAEPSTDGTIFQQMASNADSVVINEAMSSNTQVARSADGEYYDWIELHNTGDSAVSLAGLYLSDDTAVPCKWMIPSGTIAPGGYIIVYMSDKDCAENDELHSSFKLSSKGETVLLCTGDGTEISRLRIPQSRDGISYGRDESQPETCLWFAEPTPGGQNTGTKADTIDGLNIGKVDVVISEYMLNNSDTVYDSDSDYSDWLELHNTSNKSVDISGFALCDNSQRSGKWYFPEGTVIAPDGYLLVFCSGKDKNAGGELHTSFRLGSDDDALVLLTPLGDTNFITAPIELDKNVSAVLSDDGSYMRCSMPTPGTVNNTSCY